MSKKKTNKRLNKLFDDINKEQEEQQVQASDKKSKKPSQKSVASLKDILSTETMEQPFTSIDSSLERKDRSNAHRSGVGPTP